MLQQSIFNLYSLLNGNKVNKIYKEIKRRNNLMVTYSDIESANYLKSWDFNPTLSENPLMEKKDVIQWCNKLDAYNKAHTFSYTGGSMGNPLKIPLSKKRKLFKAASVRYYIEMAGYSFGDSYMMVKAKPRNALLSKIRNELIVLPRDISPENLERICEEISTRKIKIALGYTSFFHELTQYLSINNKILPTIECIVCASEALHPHQLSDIKKAFDCKILSRYSNEEVGIIAHQRETGSPYLVDKAGVVVEVLNPLTMQQCQPGEEGNIIITDLHADLFPLIRYNTGDRAIVGEYRDGQLYSLKKVIGREAEKLFNTKGNPISSLSIGPGIYKPLSQKKYNVTFQFAQKAPKEFELRIKNDGLSVDASVLEEIKQNLFEVLGMDAHIKIVVVSELTKRKSGKVPIYINEQS